jgi:hypothetical protein
VPQALRHQRQQQCSYGHDGGKVLKHLQGPAKSGRTCGTAQHSTARCRIPPMPQSAATQVGSHTQRQHCSCTQQPEPLVRHPFLRTSCNKRSMAAFSAPWHHSLQQHTRHPCKPTTILSHTNWLPAWPASAGRSPLVCSQQHITRHNPNSKPAAAADTDISWPRVSAAGCSPACC